MSYLCLTCPSASLPSSWRNQEAEVMASSQSVLIQLSEKLWVAITHVGRAKYCHKDCIYLLFSNASWRDGDVFLVTSSLQLKSPMFFHTCRKWNMWENYVCSWKCCVSFPLPGITGDLIRLYEHISVFFPSWLITMHKVWDTTSGILKFKEAQNTDFNSSNTGLREEKTSVSMLDFLAKHFSKC